MHLVYHGWVKPPDFPLWPRQKSHPTTHSKSRCSRDSGSSLTVGAFRDWLLSDEATTDALAALSPGLTPEMAAAWVAYANAGSTLLGTGADVTLGVDSAGTDWKTAGYWSALRAAAPLGLDDGRNFLRLNHAAPFAYKYWEVGNECYGSWENA